MYAQRTHDWHLLVVRRTTTSSSTASSASTNRAGGWSTGPSATTGHLRLGHSRLPLARGTLDVGGPQVVHEAWGVPCTVQLGQAVVPVSEANTGTATAVKAQEAQAYGFVARQREERPNPTRSQLPPKANSGHRARM